MTTNVYDTLGSPSQLGGNLENFSSHGWAFTDLLTHWDIVSPSNASSGVSEAPSMVDFCVHAGVLHAAWVEPQWTGSVQVMRGPYVAKWTGAAWSALGGEVDPAIQTVTLGTNPNPTGIAGTHGCPSRPKIVSDGTNLWVAYLVREVATAPNPPPNGTYVSGSCGCYVGTCDLTNYTVWTPRKAYVRIWNSGGGTWDLFGDLPAVANNSLPYDTQHGSIAPPIAEIEAYASAGEVGAVYVAFRESGGQSAIVGWLASPSCIFGAQFGTFTYPPQYRYGLRVAKYTSGTGTAGTVKTLGVETSPTGTSLAYTGTGYNPVGSAYVGNDTGTPYVFWTKRDTGQTFAMTNWTTLADAQTLPAASAPYSTEVFAYGFAHDSSTAMYYNSGANGVFETADNAASAPEAFDSAAYALTVYSPFGWPPNFTDKIASDMANGNLWVVTATSGVATAYGHLVQYHHECPAWVDWGFVTPSSGSQQPVGETIPVMIGNILYTVGAYRDPGSTATDLKVQVYQATINRLAANCGIPPMGVDPYLHGHFSTI